MSLRDILALQGVLPLGASPSTGGLRLGQLTGSWITGGETAVSTPGLRLGQLTGVWITGSGEAVIEVSPAGHAGYYPGRDDEEELLLFAHVIINLIEGDL